MNVKQVKEMMRTWVVDNTSRYPGLYAAHLVGSITAMPDGAPFPAEKDVDLILVFSPDSPSLAQSGPFSGNLEFLHQGLMVEGGLKPVSDYQDAPTVLGNPEIAYHLRRDSILYDPYEKLRAIQPQIEKEFNRRRWVRAQIEYERDGWERVAEIYGQIPETSVATRVMMMGYAFTRLSAVLCDATLQAPKVSLVKMREILTANDRLDLYHAHLTLFGLERVTPEQTVRFLQEASEAFDLAVQIRKTPHPFQHKLYPHLRPYFVGKCQRLLAAGHFQEATSWIMPFYFASCDVITADGGAAEKVKYQLRLERLLRTLGMGSVRDQQARWAESRRLGEAFFALAHEIVDAHPDMVD